MSKGNVEMQTYAARLNTFQTPHQLSKRRASSQSKKKGANTVEWPHQHPAPEELARAGFFYRPAPDSLDNAQCFLCAVKLDGWEPEDDPLKEHLAHSGSCHWAQALSAGNVAQQNDGADAADAMSEELVAARRGTFDQGVGWPHESKRGWKCKVQRMVEAGWCFDPAPITSGDADEGDGVTCFYCALSLDGWEPKDDPLEEHRRRSPECAFFALGGGAPKKGKAGAKKGGRGSTASKASRMSTQSAISEMPSVPDSVGENIAVVMDDSITSTATTASQAGGKKGAKKGGKAKAASNGRKRAGTVDSQQADDEHLYPDITSQAQQAEESTASVQAQPAEPPKKRGRGRPSKQAVDSSVMEVSSMEVAQPQQTTRGRKAKAQPALTPESAPESLSEDVSAQIQEELEHSLDLAAQDLDQSTPQAAPPKPKRGTKRTSDGVRKKQQDESEVSAMAVEFPVPPKPAPAPKAKRGRKPSKQMQAKESEAEVPSHQARPTQEDTSMSEVERPARTTKGKKGAAKGGKGRKASSTRSSSRTRGSKVATDEPADNRPEDLDRDEREIEAELARMAADQATAAQITQGMADIQTEQDKAEEYEATPSSHRHQDKHVHAIEHLEHELQAEVNTLSQPGENLKSYVQQVAKPSMSSMPGAFSPPPPSENSPPAASAHTSPSGSDKENVPSSQPPKSAAKSQPPAPILSPTKTVRLPLAPSTPNKLLSPSKRHNLSPSKAQLGPLTSTHPWLPADLDELLLASPQPSPGTLTGRLAQSAGLLSAEEKDLTVEEWVRWNAGKAEEELRRRCEGLVARFEREGVRGLGAVEGVEVIG